MPICIKRNTFWSNILRDQLLEIQNRRTKKMSWARKVFEHFLNILIVNSLILKRILRGKPLPVLDFKIELMQQLRQVGTSQQV